MFGEDLVYSGPRGGQADFKIGGWMSATEWVGRGSSPGRRVT